MGKLWEARENVWVVYYIGTFLEDMITWEYFLAYWNGKALVAIGKDWVG